MLQKIHDKLHGWVAYVVLGGMAASFVFWGINWTLAAPDYAAKVNGREISAGDLRQAYQQQLAQAQRRNGGPLSDAQRDQIKQELLDQYIGSEALLSHVQELGYRISDAELLKAESQIPAFQIDGKFDYAHAIAVLKAQGRSVAEIEGLIKRQAQLEQLDAAMEASSFATPTEVKRLNELTHQQRELAWVVVPAARYAATATPDEAAITAYYTAHRAEYMTPETVDLHYVEINLASLAAKVTVADADLKNYFDEQKTKTPENFSQPEQRRISHILIAVSDPKDDAAAKSKAEALLKRAQAGEDFAKLAKENSQDPGSASKGGDLGWSERKVFVPPFADAAFAMKVGEIRGPVKTQFGYHILKLDGIQDATTKTFEQAKSDLDAEYRRDVAEKQFNDLQDQLADAALQSSSDLDAVARKAHLSVEEIADFSRTAGGGALGNSPKVIEAAFSADALDGRVSPIIELDKGRGIVLKASDHKIPAQKPLDAVREAVVAAWKKQRGEQLAAEAAADAAKRLSAGEAWDSVAKQLAAPLQAARFVARGEAGVPLDVRRAAFELPKPGDKPEYRSVGLQDGDAAVFALSAVREDPSITPQQQLTDRHEYTAQFGAAEAQSYALATKAAAKVVVNPKAIE
jgi:peptidyl-prolyl cis-trans isomerase D